MKLSVLIPAYNEINTIEDILRKVQSVNLNKEIIIVDDYSTDGTREFLKNLEQNEGLIPPDKDHSEVKIDNLKVVFHDNNRGKGAAINSGLQHIDGDVMIIQDADLEYEPEEYHKLLAPILNGHADVVYGSRFMGGSPHRILFFWHSIGNKLLTFVSNMFTNLNLTDMETCYKMIKREIIDQITIKERGFGIEPEITAKISKLGARVYEVGISYYGRTFEEGKKITWRDGVRTVYCIFRYNLFS
ncbi:MAG: glycosyltransferase family 2 protein [Anaerolineales bacterium]